MQSAIEKTRLLQRIWCSTSMSLPLHVQGACPRIIYQQCGLDVLAISRMHVFWDSWSLLSLGVPLVSGCLSRPWACTVLVISMCLVVPLVPGRLIFPWVSVLSRGASLVLGCLPRPWVSILSLGVSLVPGLAPGVLVCYVEC